MSGIRVYLERGKVRTFACAIDWPGWARSGRSDEAALETFAAYADRYLPVARRTGLPVDFVADAIDLDVVDRVGGTSTTDYGAPDVVIDDDRKPTLQVDAARLAGAVCAAWAELDAIASIVSEQLRKGPRGGGRDRRQILDHVIGAEHSYIRKIGVAHRQPTIDDDEAIAAMRADTLAALRCPWSGEPLGLGRGRSWPPRYAARRIAWHVLDHAWEMQDKTLS